MTAPTRERPHGYARYKIDRCRCDVCRAAQSANWQRITRAKIAGNWEPFVDAEPVRRHLAVLAEIGIGYKRAADLAGLSRSVVQVLLYGKGERPPSIGVRPSTAAKLLALRPAREQLAPGALVPTVGAARRARALACIGWSLTEQARRIGWTVQNYSGTLLHRPALTVRSDQAIRGLYDELSMTPAPPGVSATRARNHAHAQGWFSPLAWDDDTIDDPAAYPIVMPPIGPTVPGADELAIQHAAAGHTTPANLDYPSRMEWARRMRDAGHPAKAIARMAGMADTSLLQMVKRGDYYAKNIGQAAAA